MDSLCNAQFSPSFLCSVTNLGKPDVVKAVRSTCLKPCYLRGGAFL